MKGQPPQVYVYKHLQSGKQAGGIRAHKTEYHYSNRHGVNSWSSVIVGTGSSEKTSREDEE